MAFTPTAPPPSPQHLAQIAEALCARAEARQRAAVAASRQRHEAWKNELSALRNTAPAPKPVVRSTGAAAILEARLARIVPPAKSESKPQIQPVQPTQLQIDAYHTRMATYFTPITLPNTATPASTTARPTPARVSKRAVPKPQPISQQQAALRKWVKVMEPMYAASTVSTIAAKAEVPVPVPVPVAGKEDKEQEEVQRPSFVNAIVKAVNLFMGRLRNRADEDSKKVKDAEVTAIGALTQALAVFTSTGKHQS